MWEVNMHALEVPKAVRTGTILTCSSSVSNVHLDVDYDLKCNQLRVSLVAGDFAFTSEWLAVKPYSVNPDSAQLILAALVRWQALLTMPSTDLQTNLSLMYTIATTFETLEHILAESS